MRAALKMQDVWLNLTQNTDMYHEQPWVTGFKDSLAQTLKPDLRRVGYHR